jgi:hypothetical protein
MRRLRPIALVTVAILSAAEAHAQTATICTILGPAARFSVLAMRKLVTRQATGYYGGASYPLQGDDVCSAQLLAQSAFGQWRNVIATRETAVAARFGVLVGKRRCGDDCITQPCDGYYPCNTHFIFGDIATGGGRVAAFGNHLPYPYDDGVIDTSGNHPLVADCRAGFAHLPGASSALAQGLLPGEPPTSARPIIDLGDVHVGRDEVRVLTPSGPGVTVYRIRDLILDHGRSYRNQYYDYVGPGGTLTFDAFSGNDEFIVVNVTGRLFVGRHSILEGESDSAIINVVGPGTSVRLHKFAEGQVPILALERRIQMLARGGGSEFYYGVAAGLFGRDVMLTGTTAIGYPLGYFDQFCSS